VKKRPSTGPGSIEMPQKALPSAPGPRGWEAAAWRKRRRTVDGLCSRRFDRRVVGQRVTSMDGQSVANLSSAYVRFAEMEARGRSPSYEALARGVAGDRDVLGFSDDPSGGEEAAAEPPARCDAPSVWNLTGLEPFPPNSPGRFPTPCVSSCRTIVQLTPPTRGCLTRPRAVAPAAS
jgi:hypothetical protein